MPYESPAIRVLGSVEELTRGDFDKIGDAPDIFTPISPPNQIIDGSIVPDP